MRFANICILALLKWQIWSTNATICLCVDGSTSTEVYSQPDLQSDVIGYLDSGECFYGYHIEGNDWVTVIDAAMEMYIKRGFLSTCDTMTIPNQDIHDNLKLPQEKQVLGNLGQVVRGVRDKRFLLDTSSLNQAQCNFDLSSLCLNQAQCNFDLSSLCLNQAQCNFDLSSLCLNQAQCNFDLSSLCLNQAQCNFDLSSLCLNQAQCNFDLSSLCSWRNVHGSDDFDWVLYQSSTPTDDTGPDNDHTLRNATGKYVFIESSAPRSMFDSAWI
ncbi:hypothetical protein DPMN_145096 [Dreissena polymorpha]|uniref:MAM domain-containing protein n=1 Tax=Dreissena polymorpha TaxID=45954 RepID=A0A9D4F4F8_DREPO|nr:hypothetical protein DPMN_145096 [Dreissena polymorpha]